MPADGSQRLANRRRRLDNRVQISARFQLAESDTGNVTQEHQWANVFESLRMGTNNFRNRYGSLQPRHQVEFFLASLGLVRIDAQHGGLMRNETDFVDCIS